MSHSECGWGGSDRGAPRGIRWTLGIPTARPEPRSDPLAEHRSVAGRVAYAALPEAWIDLEDKVAIEAFWGRVGMPQAPSTVVTAGHNALRAAADALGRGQGTRLGTGRPRGRHRPASGPTRRRRTGGGGVPVTDRPPRPRHALPGGDSGEHPRHRVSGRRRRSPSGQDAYPPAAFGERAPALAAPKRDTLRS